MANSRKRFIVDEQGKRQAIVLPIKEYEELLEDLADLAVIAERADEPLESLEVVKKRLEKRWQITPSS